MPRPGASPSPPRSLVLAGCSSGPSTDPPSTDAPPAPATSPSDTAVPTPTTTPPQQQPSLDATSSPESPTSTEPITPTGETVVVTAGLAAPWSIVTSGDAVLVSERDSGRVLEVLTDGTTREAGTVPGVLHGGEGGLLGLAIDPSQTAGDPGLFVYSTTSEGNRVQRFPLLGATGSLTLGEPTTVLDGIPHGRTHNGGRLAVGPDGMLYIGTGDAGDRSLAQDPASLAGKILRLTPQGTPPPDNPDPTSPVWSLGHRNVQGLAWTADGRLVATEFGQDTWDELNVIEPGGNYGWPEVEGIAGVEGFLDPVQQWEPGVASPSGLASVQGSLVVANLKGERLRVVPSSDLTQAEELLVEEVGRIRDAVVTPDGQLWILTNNTDGRGSPGVDDDRLLAVPFR